MYAQIARELSLTWRIQYLTAARPGDRIRIAASLAGRGAAAATAIIRLPGSSASDAGGSWLPDVALGNIWAELLFALLIGGLVLFAVRLVLARPKGSWARERVAPHVEPASAEEQDAATAPPRQKSESLATLYQATEKRFGRKRAWRRVDHLLEQADLPLKTAELVVALGRLRHRRRSLCSLLGLPTWVALLAFAGGAAAPYLFVKMKAHKRIQAFDAQLADVLITLAASLRAGHSLRQGILAVVEEAAEPSRKEFGRVLTEASLGRPMEDALADMAARLGSQDFDYVVTAVTVQRQVGGALAGLLDLVADTVRGRQQFVRKVRSLTAMGRMSALILIALPFIIAVALSVLNPGYMEPLYDTYTGHVLMALGFAGIAVGSLFLKKIVSFKG